MKYYKTFDFYDTLQQALKAQETIYNKYYNKYMKYHYKKPVVTSWTSSDKTEQKYICWYYR